MDAFVRKNVAFRNISVYTSPYQEPSCEINLSSVLGNALKAFMFLRYIINGTIGFGIRRPFQKGPDNEIRLMII